MRSEAELKKFIEQLLTKSDLALSRTKSLEKTLKKMSDQLAPQLAEKVSQLCSGLDELPSDEKRKALSRIKNLLEKSPPKKKPSRKIGLNLKSSVRFLKGIGERLEKKLAQKGIRTIEDLIFYLPYRYEDRRNFKKISQLSLGERAVVAGRVVACGETRTRAGVGFQALIDDGTGTLSLRWFHHPGGYLQEKLKKGRIVIASEKVRRYGPILEMDHPEIEVLEQGEELDSLSFARIVPIYSIPEGFSQKSFRNVIARALELVEQVPELIPKELLKKRGLPLLKEAIRLLHFPPPSARVAELNEKRSLWHSRLYYEDFFLLELALALSKKGISEQRSYPIRGGEKLVRRLKESLPFKLTSAQERVIREIEADLARSKPMHRLLQGDVGSGKTIVALFSALRVISAGLQVAVMAPSEVLAEQHWLNLHRWLDKLGVKSALLTSAVRGAERERILKEIKSGKIALVVGTQALIQKRVEFKRLGLGIIDEQHRFGVQQRALLKAKGLERTPHILVMTATPIPRSLAMTVYGDLDLSLLDQLPPGRKPPKTYLIFADEVERAWQEVRRRAERGEQAYIVYPLVESSTRLALQDATQKYHQLKDEVFREFQLGLIHGRLKPEEKEEVMERFRRGEIQILIATTVIEVGIDVPRATCIVIENAERFGLSQLHQLRGRVARSERESVCFLVAHSPLTETARKRLEVIASTTDGFKITEADLRLRGPGEFLGTRQSGLVGLRFADLVRDVKELSWARADAFSWAETADWNREDLKPLKKELMRRYQKTIQFARVG